MASNLCLDLNCGRSLVQYITVQTSEMFPKKKLVDIQVEGNYDIQNEIYGTKNDQ